MNVRPTVLLLCLAALVWTACPAPSPAPTDDLASSVDLLEVNEPDTAPPPGLLCCESGVCPVGALCIEGACHGAPGASGCYNKGGCAPGQECQGAVTCPCEDESCVPDSGTCAYPEGCCNADTDCGGRNPDPFGSDPKRCRISIPVAVAFSSSS